MQKAFLICVLLALCFIGCRSSRKYRLVENSPYVNPVTGDLKPDSNGLSIWKILGITKTEEERDAENLRARQEKRIADLERKELERLNDVRWGL